MKQNKDINLLKKYWWLFAIAFIIAVALLVKVIDSIFSFSWGIFALNHIKAPDVLSFLGGLIGSIIALAAIYVAIRHFTVEKKIVIVPHNTGLYLYNDFCGLKGIVLPSPDIKRSIGANKVPTVFYLENVTSNSALNFSIEIDYDNGSYYRDIISAMGIESTYEWGYKSVFKTFNANNISVFNASSKIPINVPNDVKGMIKNFCILLGDTSIDTLQRIKIGGHLSDSPLPIARLTVTTMSSTGERSSSTYIMSIVIDAYLFGEADYEIILSFQHESNM